MGLKTIKMKWDLCSSVPCVPFYPYTTFQNHTFLSKLQETRITEKSTCPTKFSHSALQSAYPKTYMCRLSSLFKHFFPVQIDISFFIFCQGKFSKQANISHFVDFDWEKASKWLEWSISRVQGMLNTVAQVLRLCEKWFLKNKNFRQTFSHFVDFDWEKHIEMVWVVHIQGLRHAKSNGAGFESLW